MIFIGNIGYLAPFNFCMGHGVIHLMDRGFPKETAAMSVGLVMLFSIAGRLIGGVLGDRIEPRFVWSGACISMLAGTACLMTAVSLPCIYAYAVLMGLGFGVSFVMMPTTIGNYFGPAAFASIVGAISPVYALFSATAPLAGGYVYDSTGNYAYAFIAAIALCAAGAAALLFARPKGESSAAHGTA
jgi:MFS family permease